MISSSFRCPGPVVPPDLPRPKGDDLDTPCPAELGRFGVPFTAIAFTALANVDNFSPPPDPLLWAVLGLAEDTPPPRAVDEEECVAA
jgi:hypothetical protein